MRITASLVFDTGWRIGSGKEGETMSDLGVLLDHVGNPILPGSSLKGKLRSTCETLAHALDLTTCLLNHKASAIKCTSDVQYYGKREVRDKYREIVQGQCLGKRLKWIDKHTCDVCKLFGSPIQAGRIWVSDGMLESWASMVQVRDSVVIDRDSQTAVDRLKFNYEVVPPDSRFTLCIDMENPSDADLALMGVALFDWHAGSSLGGFTSRGLGRFHLEQVKVRGVDLTDATQRVKFLTQPDAQARLSDWGDWETFFTDYIHPN